MLFQRDGHLVESDGRDSGGDVAEDLSLKDVLLVYVSLCLGVLVSLVLAAWALSFASYVIGSGVMFGPVQLLSLVGGVVQRGIYDWRTTSCKPLVVRLIRVFLIGVSWPMWIKRM